MPSKSKSVYIFRALTTQAYVIKNIIDLLVSVFHTSDGNFTLGEEGIFSSYNDKGKTKLVHISLPREGFLEYECKKELNIGITLKVLLSHIKEVKKKDSIILFVEAKNATKLGIEVIPNNPVGRNKSVTSHIQYYSVENFKRTVPEDTYNWSMSIKSTEFQRICKQITALKAKSIIVKQQKDFFISFFIADGDLSDKEIKYGDYNDEFEEEDYEKEFTADRFSQLSKLCQMTPSIRLSYSPMPGLPIRISSKAGDLGDIKVFIKDKTQILYETEQYKLENEE